MPILATKSERQRAEYMSLTKHYRGIGPAAILAAVLAAPRKRTVETTKSQTMKKSA